MNSSSARFSAAAIASAGASRTCASRITDLARAALVLTRFEHGLINRLSLRSRHCQAPHLYAGRTIA